MLGVGRPPPTDAGQLTGPGGGVSSRGPPATDDKDLFDRPFRKKKAKISHSSTVCRDQLPISRPLAYLEIFQEVRAVIIGGGGLISKDLIAGGINCVFKSASCVFYLNWSRVETKFSLD